MTSPRPRAQRDDAAWGVCPRREVAAFGLRLHGPLPIRSGWSEAAGALPALNIETAAPDDVELEFWQAGAAVWSATIDGRPFAAVRGVDGSVLFRHEGAGLYLLSADRASLRVAQDADNAVQFSRTLVDSVLFTVALEVGYEALHGAGLKSAAGVIAVLGVSGAGKSSLARALRDEGLQFFSDDILMTEVRDGAVVAHPGPPVETVPRDGSAAEDVLADLGTELWVARHVSAGPEPVVGVVVLAPPERLSTDEAPLFTLLPHLLKVPSDRARGRFERAGDIAQAVPVVRVAARSEPPAMMARTVMTHLRQAGIDL